MFRIVIPARYGSSRFPGKVLATIAGRPLLEWVHRNALRAGAEQVVIGVDDERVATAARSFGATVVMTATQHASGTDRIAQVAALLNWAPETIVVNLQGDEPMMPPALLGQVAALLAANPGAAIATLAAPVRSLEEFLDTNAVKVVADGCGRALYFSRAPIPWQRDGAAAGLTSQRSWGDARRHLGLYAYRVSGLQRLASLPMAPLEDAEKLEQLRALYAGLEIRIADASEPPGADVNTPADLQRAEVLLRAQRN